MLSSLLLHLGRILTYVQLILYLPLALDLSGQDCFNALSASLALYYFFLSTIRLFTKGTKLAWLGHFLAIFQFIVVPACLLISFNAYSPPEMSYFGNVSRGSSYAATPLPSTGDSTSVKRIENAGAAAISLFRSKISTSNSVEKHLESLNQNQDSSSFTLLVSYSISLFRFLASRIPTWWSTLLRLSSPGFSLLEGVATLLVIQSLGSTSRWIISRSLSSPPSPSARPPYLPSFSFGLSYSESFQLLFLVLSAVIYVFSFLSLYLSFEGAVKNSPGIATAVGASLASTFWLTGIAFSVRKGNVVETSLMLAYVVFNICTLDSLAFTADPLTLIRSFKVQSFSSTSSSSSNAFYSSISHYLSPYLLDQLTSLLKIVKLTLGQSLDFISAAVEALPKSVIVSLVYRLAVLYAAGRVLKGLGKTHGKRIENTVGGIGSRNASKTNLNQSANDEIKEGDGVKEPENQELQAGQSNERVQEILAQRNRKNSGRRNKGKRSGKGRKSNGNQTESESSSESETSSGTESSETDSETSETEETETGSESETESQTETESESSSDSEDERSSRRKYKSSSKKSTKGLSKSEIRKRYNKKAISRRRKSESKNQSGKGNAGKRNKKRLREEESFGTFIEVIGAYSRLILIAVYSHLLMLDQSHKVYWRFLTIGITLSIWTVELILGREDSDSLSNKWSPT